MKNISEFNFYIDSDGSTETMKKLLQNAPVVTGLNNKEIFEKIEKELKKKNGSKLIIIDSLCSSIKSRST